MQFSPFLLKLVPETGLKILPLWGNFHGVLLELILGGVNEEADGFWKFIRFPGMISPSSGMSIEPALGPAFYFIFLKPQNNYGFSQPLVSENEAPVLTRGAATCE